jgi:hypothetical protein
MYQVRKWDAFEAKMNTQEPGTLTEDRSTTLRMPSPDENLTDVVLTQPATP